VSDSLYGIRATRASPPGFARDDNERRRVYGAALAQFDELIAASAAVGPASRPLPLFYALSQAGRAIAAAHAETAWRLRWHGLSSQELSMAPLDIEVSRMAAVSKDERSVDSVTGVADATGSEVFAKATTIGALWSSLPEVFDLLPASFSRELIPMRLVLEPDPEGLRGRIDQAHLYTVAVDFDGTPDELDNDLSDNYPTSIGMNAYRPFQGQPVMRVLTHFGDGLGSPLEPGGGSRRRPRSRCRGCRARRVVLAASERQRRRAVLAPDLVDAAFRPLDARTLRTCRMDASTRLRIV